MTKLTRTQQGLTIVELVVATAVTGLLILAIANTFITVVGIQRQSRNLSLATNAIESKLESLRNAKYNEITTSPPPVDFESELPAELGGPRLAQVIVSEPRPDVKRLDAIVAWQEGSLTRTVKLSTLVGKLGINQ